MGMTVGAGKSQSRVATLCQVTGACNTRNYFTPRPSQAVRALERDCVAHSRVCHRLDARREVAHLARIQRVHLQRGALLTVREQRLCCVLNPWPARLPLWDLAGACWW